MTQFEDVLETILEEYARRDSEGEFDTWEETDAFVKEKAEILLAYVKEEPVSEDLEIAANEWNTKVLFTPFYMTLDDEGNPNGVRQDYTTHAESFKAGAQWQKEQMKEALRTEYEKGRHDAIEEMKKSTTEAT